MHSACNLAFLQPRIANRETWPPRRSGTVERPAAAKVHPQLTSIVTETFGVNVEPDAESVTWQRHVEIFRGGKILPPENHQVVELELGERHWVPALPDTFCQA